MNISLSLLLALSFLLLCGKSLKKHAGLYYLLALFMSLGSILLLWNGKPALDHPSLHILTKGAFATALFIVVMYMGALPEKSRLARKLLPLRGEASILASILILGHNIAYGKRFFVALLSGKKMPLIAYMAMSFSGLAILVMLPLFVTSFMKIRRKMAAKSWKRLQRWAYLYYFLIWLHIFLIYGKSAAKGNLSSLTRLILYHLLFAVYLFARVQKAVYKRKAVSYSFPWARSLLFANLTLYLVLAPFARSYLEREKAAKIEREAEMQELREALSHGPMTWKDGSYEGYAYGYVDKVVVEVEVKEGKIAAIHILEEQEDYEYMVNARKIVDKMLAANSLNVDTIAGATTSANAIKYATKRALKKAE